MRKPSHWWVYPLCVIIAITIFSMIKDFMDTNGKTLISSTYQGRTVVLSVDGNVEYQQSRSGLELLFENGKYMHVDMLNFAYHDSFLKEVDEFGYVHDDMVFNGYQFRHYVDDEDVHYFITAIPDVCFLYIHTNDRESTEDILSKTKIYLK